MKVIIVLLLLIIANVSQVSAKDYEVLFVLIEYKDIQFQRSYDGVFLMEFWENRMFTELNEYFANTFDTRRINLVPFIPEEPVIVFQIQQPHHRNRMINGIRQADIDINRVINALIYEFNINDAENLLIYIKMAGIETSASMHTEEIGIHGHAYIRQFGQNGQAVGILDRQVISWAVSGELTFSNREFRPTEIGIMAHEILHLFGMPDKFNRQVGSFCVMGINMWGARLGETLGSSPAHLSAILRKRMGDDFTVPEYYWKGALNRILKINNNNGFYLLEIRNVIGTDIGIHTRNMVGTLDDFRIEENLNPILVIWCVAYNRFNNINQRTYSYVSKEITNNQISFQLAFNDIIVQVNENTWTFEMEDYYIPISSRR